MHCLILDQNFKAGKEWSKYSLIGDSDQISNIFDLYVIVSLRHFVTIASFLFKSVFIFPRKATFNRLADKE